MIDPRLRALAVREENSGACFGRWISATGETIASIDPATGRSLARVQCASLKEYEEIIEKACCAFQEWRLVPPPKRGEIVRLIGESLRKKTELGRLVSLEVGKIHSEGEGEVQEMIDMCDFAVGLSRQLHGLTIASERPRHRLFEQWHPLGPIGVITAFNFPVAVWAWNAAVAAVCGNTVVWKPSPETPLCAIAVQNIVNEVMKTHGYDGVFNLCVGGVEIGEAIAGDSRLPLISATGSCRMGRRIGKVVGDDDSASRSSNSAATTPRSSLPRPISTWRSRDCLRRRRNRRPTLHEFETTLSPRIDRG